jgi:hypothetical protein
MWENWATAKTQNEGAECKEFGYISGPQEGGFPQSKLRLVYFFIRNSQTNQYAMSGKFLAGIP